MKKHTQKSHQIHLETTNNTFVKFVLFIVKKNSVGSVFYKIEEGK